MISKRIKEIASFLEDAKSFVDIGCDHAYLAIYAIKNLGILENLSTDISPNALEYAKNNVAKYHLEDKIKLSLGDGLDVIDKEYDSLVISGMGGILMRDILARNLDKLSNFKYLIFSPNTDAYILRKFLADNNYEIIDEKFIHDYKYYPIIKAKISSSKISYSELELKYGPIVLKNRPIDFIDYINKEYAYFTKIEADDDKIKENIKQLALILKK